MASARYDIVIDQGSAFVKILDVNLANSAPLDLTGYTYQCAIRQAQDSSSALILTLTVTKDSVLSNRLSFSATSAQTAAIPNTTSRVAFWDLQIIAPDTTNTRLLEGVARIDLRTSP